MTSLPANFVFGSASSAQNVRDVIASYRRAQYIAAEPRATDSDSEEELVRPLNKQDDGVSNTGGHTAGVTTVGDNFLDQLDWDEESHFEPQEESRLPVLGISRFGGELRLSPVPGYGVSPLATTELAHEATPLLRKAVSFSATSHPRRAFTSSPNLKFPTSVRPRQASLTRSNLPSSTSSSQSGTHNFGGKSTFGQTLFNSIAILVGIGMLSEPLAFAYSGWITGTALIISYGFISCYTAKILARIILADPRTRSYADIGRKAFGPTSTPLISGMFCLELFSVSVVLVTLYADSLHTIFPQYSATTYKFLGGLLLIPTVFLPLSLLAYTSILGIISSVLVIFVVLFDGFSKYDPPGSFWSPAETSISVGSWNNLGLAFGLFMAGFSGHAVIPLLATDMTDPSQFDKMINWAFVVATFLYALIGYAGYLMFGNFVSDEISVDLLKTSGYNPALNNIALWMLVISPLSKFALTTYPLNSTIETLLGVRTASGATRDQSFAEATRKPPTLLKRFFSPFIIQRVLVTLFSILVSILVPEFGSMMAFLGSFSAFILCVIGPISAKIMLEGRCGIFDGVVLAIGIVKAIWGTAAAFYGV